MGISSRIELRHLRCLVVLAEELSFRRAAERLHMTQPPLSRTIAQLEEAVGARLFERSRVHCALTPLGAAVAADAGRLLSDFSAATLQWEAAAAKPQAQRDVRLGLFFALNARHFCRLERVFSAREPNRRLELVVDRTHVLLDQVRRRRLDAALVLLPAPTEELCTIELAQTQMMALLPASSALARRQTVRIAQLAEIPALLFMRERDNPPLYRYLDDALRARGLERPRYRIPRDTYSGMADIAAGKACTIVCRTMLDAGRQDVAFRPLHSVDRIPAALGLVHHPAVPALLLESLQMSVAGYLDKVLGRTG